MSMSLREQLLAAGFGKKKAAEQAERKAQDQQRAARERQQRVAKEQQRVDPSQAAQAEKAA
jgi:hypothetical protein